MQLRFSVVVSICLMASACATRALHPGAVNTFDSQAYDTLLTVQAALETASKEVVAYPNLKPELNRVIDAYNGAMVAYKAYHEAALAGKSADQSQLATLIQNLSAAVATIIRKLHPPAPPKASLLLPLAA